jgi:Ni,Fe-hydrogenase maturation factor
MSIFGNFKDFLAKLDKVTWKTPDNDLAGSYTKVLVSTDGNWKLSYSIEEMTSIHDMPFQAVIRLSYGGQYITQWGCISEEENKEWMIWLIQTRNAVNKAVNDAEKAARKTGEDMWRNL